MRFSAKCLAFLAILVLPTIASAQATLTGTVRDTSGAVLPGVTVEASSPALIEKVRSAVTDGSGQYRIIDLRAGTYTTSFVPPGEYCAYVDDDGTFTVQQGGIGKWDILKNAQELAAS